VTIRQHCINYCVERGMFPHDAETVFGILISSNSMESMKGRWDDEVSGYPPFLITTIQTDLNVEAIEWIEKNKPKAFYKSLFEEVAQRED
jgi:hypothetical protein